MPGERLPGEHELALRYEVSYLTMRKAITSLVDSDILLRVRGKGTFVSDNRPRSETVSSKSMALLLPGVLFSLDPHYFPELLEGFQGEMNAQGKRAAIQSYDILDTHAFLDPGAAVACLLFETPDLQLIEHLRDSGYRVLAINQYSGRRSIPCVRIDDGLGMDQAVAHLVSLGHERIGFIAGPTANIDAGIRLRGFRAASRKYALKAATESGEGFTEASGYAAARQLLSAPNRPTAIVCASDLSALGAIKAAEDSGLSVPRGISIVGFGDFSVANYTSPRLTTVRQKRRLLGQMAAKSLIEIADGGDPGNSLLSTDLIIRESTVQTISSYSDPALAEVV